MSITLEKTAISDLQQGMYVARLDRPWLETPYKVQGILIRDDEEIERLMQYCNEQQTAKIQKTFKLQHSLLENL